MKFPNKGLYAITQTEGKSEQSIINEVEAVLRGGASVIQYRDKSEQKSITLARALKDCCHRFSVPLIINDDAELAQKIDADGVHLGRDDGELIQARETLGPDKIIGISCYNDLAKAQQMEQLGADYVAFGRFFPSHSKPLASPAKLDTLTAAKQKLDIPIVAIGGILPGNASILLAAGADVLAVINGIFNMDPESAARDFHALFS